MATGIKNGNYKLMAALIAGNLALYFVAMHASGVEALTDLRRLVSGVLGVGGGLALLVLLNGVIDSVDKARLIYWRWHDPLPGSRAFTVEAAQDPRIDMARLEEKLGPFPKEGPAQNSLWYQVYKPLAKEPAVLDAHRGFLLGRDYTIFALLQLLILGPLSVIQFSSLSWAIGFIVVLAIQCGAAWVAAAHYGRRLVTNVLALRTAQKT